MGKSGWEQKTALDGMVYYFNKSNGEVSWDKPDELQTKAEIEANKGDWVWLPHPDLLWQPGRIINKGSDGTECQTEQGKKVVIPKSGILNGPLTAGRDQKVPLWELRRSALQHLEDDLVMLDGINEGMIAHTLRERYKKDELYTYVGASRNVLVSVNPYKKLNIYTNKHIEDHFRKIPNMKLPPHTFGIASDSYESLLNQGGHQSILISGESGAGKTVCTKQCLQFLAHVAGSKSNIEDKILMCNPLLEAFGNAKTIRNNNSSRFGKFIEVHFNVAQREIISAKILNYLLEKSRVVFQQKGERNFHIFYQMAQDAELSSKYEIGSAEDFHFMNQSGLIKTHDVDDAEDLAAVRKALKSLEFTPEEQEWVFRTTAAILHLGNVEFKLKKEKANVEGSSIKDMKPVSIAADFLGVSEKELERVLCYRSIAVRRETSVIPLNPQNARDGCDALCKGIYGRLFDYLVMKVNQVLNIGSDGKIIGILDIFGFEIFENNSFEQLCINYANEKLQQQFNRTTFKEEEALYSSQGIKFKHIEFIDNQVVLDLIEKKPVGILLMLDEEGLVPEGSSDKFMNKIEAQHKRNEKFQTDKHRKLESSLAFEIVHYAGVVRYNAAQFMEKNKDTLFSDMYGVCAASKDDMTAALFPSVDRRQLKSLSYEFRGQLNDLMTSLYETESRYIRCVKPNNKQVPNQFDTPLVVEQLRYSGVFEAVEIRKQGYPFRLTYRQFHYRYRCINQGHNYKARDDRGICEEILKVAKQDFSEVQFGKTMVLYRSNEHRTLKLLRNLALESTVPVCQKVIRGGIHREFGRRLKRAHYKLQDALDVANDIDMMEEAIAAVKPTIGPLYSVFPKARPVNLTKAEKAREDLKKWKQLEAIFERLTQVEKPNDREFDELSSAVERAGDLLHIPRTDNQIKLYDLAKGQVIYFSIKLKEKHLEEQGHKYENLGSFAGIRDAKEFAKKKALPFGRKKLEETMLLWTKAGIPTALTTIQDKPMDKLAVQTFTAILKYCGEKKAPMPEEFAAQVLGNGIANSELRDEIFAQLIKQATNNENPESLGRVWDLTALCIQSFVPSTDFENFLLMHFQKSDEYCQQLTSAFHNTKYGEKPKSAPSGSAIPGMVSNFKKNKERSRYSVMPNRR